MNLQHEIEKFKTQRRCVRCHAFYNLMSSTGKYACRYHPCFLFFDKLKHCSLYECGSPIDSIGCTPCEHIEDFRQSKTPLKVYLEILEMLDVCPDNDKVINGEIFYDIIDGKKIVNKKKSYVYIITHPTK